MQARRDGVATTRATILRACALALSLLVWGPALAQAQPASVEGETVAYLPRAAVALARFGEGVAALLDDGRLVRVTDAGVRTLRHDLDSEVLVECVGALLAVDQRGRLVVGAYAPGTDRGSARSRDDLPVGPPVSLHSTPLCLPDGGVVAIDPNGVWLLRLDAELLESSRAMLRPLPDGAPVWLGDGLVALPVEATLRYRHGVLGDEVEAAGVAIVDAAELRLLARWRTPGSRVIEDRRVVAFPAAGRWGVVATMSGGGDGGALVVLGAREGASTAGGPRLAPIAVAPGIGQERRWRHTLGAADGRLYSVATPHLGGPLERWTLPDLDSGQLLLRRERFELDVTSHRIGRRELDLGALLPRGPGDPAGVDLLLLASRDLRALRWIVCRPSGCAVAAVLELPTVLATSPVFWRDEGGGTTVWVALEDGALLRARLPGDGILTQGE